MPMLFARHRALAARGALLGVLLLAAACSGTTPAEQLAPDVVAMLYGQQIDGEYLIAAVDPGYITNQTRRQLVTDAGPEAPGSLVVDPFARVLYHVQEGGVATRYGVAVGKEGLAFRGNAKIGRKAEWPGWQPTRNMIRTQPETYAQFAEGLPGGLDNPLGARALYLYRGSRDTLYRIHGTNNASTIGQATSAGCIRLYNQDIIHLYEQIDPGVPVRVRDAAESVAMEGVTVNTPNGFAVPAASLDPGELAALAVMPAPADPFGTAAMTAAEFSAATR